jgi:hypothetical protein
VNTSRALQLFPSGARHDRIASETGVSARPLARFPPMPSTGRLLSLKVTPGQRPRVIHDTVASGSRGDPQLPWGLSCTDEALPAPLVLDSPTDTGVPIEARKCEACAPGFCRSPCRAASGDTRFSRNALVGRRLRFFPHGKSFSRRRAGTATGLTCYGVRPA